MKRFLPFCRAMDDGAVVDACRLVEGWIANVDERKRFAYALNVICRGGLRAVFDRPRIIVGTVHSVKGGEADTVLFLPDLPPAGARDGSRDALVSIHYVAATRAKRRLIYAEPASAEAFAMHRAGTSE